eukprot:gene255-470_t
MKFDFSVWFKGGPNVAHANKSSAIQWDSSSVEPAILRVPTVVLFMLLLWGINIWVFERIRLQYYNVLLIRTASLQFIFYTVGIITTLYIVNMTLMSQIGASIELGIIVFYFIILLSFITPSIPGNEHRNYFLRLLRLVCFPATTVTFPEVLLADALTSLSRVFKDFGVAIISIYSKAFDTAIIDHHDFAMILIAVLASIPYWIRVRQCSIQLDNATDIHGKIPITLNIIKYCTSFPPIWLAAASSLGYTHPSLPMITAVAATVNSLYGFFWDITMDWGLLTVHRGGRISTRTRFLVPYPFHFIAATINLFLRFLWAANQIPYFSQMNPTHLLLVVELAEVFRRGVWNIFRVEWEILVQQDKASIKLRDREEMESDKSLLLPPNNHSLK